MHNHTFSAKQSGAIRLLLGGPLLCLATSSGAAVYNWNGGSGDWDTTSSNWTGAGTIWPASGTDNDAVFAGTPGTVLITGGGGTVNDITLNTSGYTISGGTLTFNGSTPVMTVAGGVSSTISAPLASAVALTKAGTGTVSLSGTGSSLVSLAATEGTVHVSGGNVSLSSAVTVGTSAPLTGTFRITAGTVSTPAVSVAGGSSVIRLEGGTLKADSINLGGTGTFVWGAGTLAHNTPNGAVSNPEYSLGPVAYAGANVSEGSVLTFTGNLTTGTGSVLDLGIAHTTSGAFRFNRLLVSGALDLTGLNDELRLSFNPYLLRAQKSYWSVADIDYGSIPLVQAASIAGQFDLHTILAFDSGNNSFTFAGVNVVTSAADLATDTWSLEYDTGENTIWLHYKVSPTIPEPATAGLIFLSVASARIASKFRRRKAGKESDEGRFDDESKSSDSWFDPASKL